MGIWIATVSLFTSVLFVGEIARAATTDSDSVPDITTQTVGASVVLNEIKSKSGDGSEFVELFNPTASTVDFSNWTI